MAWTSPTLVEICVGLEISGYLPAERRDDGDQTPMLAACVSDSGCR